MKSMETIAADEGILTNVLIVEAGTVGEGFRESKIIKLVSMKLNGTETDDELLSCKEDSASTRGDSIKESEYY
eukprot:SAG31_NODE_1018_length_10354_cov_10.995514_11_plen_73_part_00